MTPSVHVPPSAGRSGLKVGLKMSERYAPSIPRERKLQIVLQLIEKAIAAGAQPVGEYWDYWGGELDLVLAIKMNL